MHDDRGPNSRANHPEPMIHPAFSHEDAGQGAGPDQPSAPRRRPRKRSNKTWPILAAGLLVVVWLQIQAMTNQAAADKTTSGTPRLIKYVLHGSTPSMAWSPDSKKLVVNAAYEYFGFDRDIRQDRPKLGLYVVDVRSGKVAHVISGRQAYHPFWLDNATVGWGHSVYEKGMAGIFLHKLGTPQNKFSRVGTVRGVYNTSLGSRLLRSTKGKILFWNGFPESKETWMLADPKTGRVSRAPAVHGKLNSWEVPKALSEDQCLQKTGKVSVSIMTDQVQVKVGRRKVTLPGIVPVYSNSQCMAPGRNTCNGSLKPCLSPNGDHVAYFTVQSGIGGLTRAGPPTVGHIALELRIVRISH